MNHCIRRARLATLPLALAAAFPSLAQTAPVQVAALGETVVTATRNPTRTDDLVSDVVVIDRATIEAGMARTLPELLARNAGLQVSANGTTGKTSSVFIRGTESRHTILLVDGVRYGSATAGTPNWDTIPLDMIERIEVLKGPASALYGSEGVGGVVQIFTRRGREGFHPYASATVGSERWREWTGGFTGGQGAWTWALGLQQLRERGISSTNPNVQFGNFNADRDPFNQDALNASVALQINPHWRADASVLYSDGVSHYDDGPGIDTRSAVRALTAQAGLKGRVLAGWDSELRYARGVDTSDTLVASSPGAFKTVQDQWTWQNTVDTPLGVVLAGAEHRVQTVSGSTAYSVSERTLNGLFAGLNGSAGPHSWQLNVRRDRNSQFGGSSTGFAGYGYRINPAWRINVSHGTSFVAPSFNQLYYPGFGNPLLQPERGRNTDLGLTWAAGGHEVKLVRFDNKIRGYMTNTTLPVNIPRSRIDGWTLGYEGQLGGWSLRAGLDTLNPRNELNDRQLPRRAKRQLSLGVDHRTGAWRYGASLLQVGQRFDDAANTRVLAAYTTLDLHADWQFAPQWSLQAKVNNLTDRAYETAWGYNQAGRTLYLTLRWQPK
ncbi:MAG: TonB-dependent receptor [Ramlibacter sp.]|nr:TonB-dependent receptor [Ramlibacter sp.]